MDAPRTRPPVRGVWLLGLVAGTTAAFGCLAPTHSLSLAHPTKARVVLILDRDATRSLEDVPPVLSARIGKELTRRNLLPETLSRGEVTTLLGRRRETSQRLSKLLEEPGDAPFLVMVEMKARFFSLLNGRYKWTVHARVSVASPKAPQDAVSQEEELPALLEFEHERESEAVVAVSSILADRVGAAVDRFLEGQDALPTLESAHVMPSSTDPDLLYFVLLDRFANGDRSNDRDVDPSSPIAWHGGDIRGLTQHLDDLYQLGVRTLWLSPIFASRQTSFMGHGAFHGYWVRDLTKMEPRFGTLADLQALSSAVHRRGMRLLLDMVINHVSYDAPLKDEHPEWFHDTGPIRDWEDPVQLTESQVHGLPDLAQERPEVLDYLVSTASGWISRANPDGFRLDAVKHVRLEVWSGFNRAVLEGAPPLFELLGEMYTGNPFELNRVLVEGHFTRVFDFPSYFAVTDVACRGQSPGRLAATMWGDRFYDDPSKLVTFVDNHDLPRIASACGEDPGKTLQAISIWLTLRGTPCMTYGTEMALAGTTEPDNRSDMVFAVKEAPNPPLARLVHERVTRLLRLRKEVPALAGPQTFILDLEPRLLVYLRATASQAAIVAVHTGNSQAAFSLPRGVDSLIWRDVDSGALVPPTDLPIGPHGVRILVAESESGPVRRTLEGLAKATGRDRAIRVQLAPDAAPEGEIFLVGLGPELGNWDPAHALGPLSRQGEGPPMTVHLPSRGVYEFKLIAKRGQQIQWEDRDNRYLFVHARHEPLDLELGWNAAMPIRS